MKTCVIYTYESGEEGIDGYTAAPTLAAARSGARDIVESGILAESRVCRTECVAPDIRRLACRLHNHSGYAAHDLLIGTWQATKTEDDMGYTRQTGVVWVPAAERAGGGA